MYKLIMYETEWGLPNIEYHLTDKSAIEEGTRLHKIQPTWFMYVMTPDKKVIAQWTSKEN